MAIGKNGKNIVIKINKIQNITPTLKAIPIPAIKGVSNINSIKYTDDNDVEISGKHSQSYEILTGLRVSDTFRLELDYTHTKAIWNQMSFDGETFLLNAIIDARIDSIYRILRNQMIMPYVGIGAGASWNTGKNTTNIDIKVSPVVAAMAGISIEFNPHFALDFGYRYLYMFNQKNNIVDDLNATAHQFRVGARVGF